MEARLINLESRETTIINKPVFRIGREKSYVDLCIRNSTISRSHCDIIKRNGWYLVDMNSTNRTYINDVLAPPTMEICLRHGDVIRMSNVRYRYEEVL